MPRPDALRLAVTRVAMALWMALSAASVQAADPESPQGPGPSPLGLSCITCHGLAQRPDAHAVRLGTLTQAQLAEALRAYRSGERPGTVMPRITRPLTDAEIDALAEELGRRP